MSTRSLNKVMLIGNLTRDPELRYTPQGTAVCTFGVATNRQWTPSDGGERQEEAEFHRIVAWAKLAEICSQILYKGRKVYVEGRLQTRNWTGQDGQERQTTEVVIDSMIALGPPKAGINEEYADDASDISQDYSQPDTGTEKVEQEEEVTKPEKKEKAKTEVKKPKAAVEEKKEEVSEDDIPF